MGKENKKSDKIKVKKCNGFLFNFLCFFCGVYFFFRGVHIKTKNNCGKIKGPAIVLCNHGSFIDFYYSGKLLRKSRPHYIIARLYFYNKWLKKLLLSLGGFPKSMFQMDTESIKNCLTVLNNGEVLAMMPEARLSTAGSFEDIQESTYSFIKKSAVPVYTVKIDGDYFADPKWGKGFRRGALVEAELDILYTAEEVKNLSVGDIKRGIEARLYYNEFEWLKTKPDVKYKNKNLAEGLENILISCPICGKKYTLTTKGREIYCEHCGKLAEIDSRYAFDTDFKYSNFAEWYARQKQEIKENILNDESFALKSSVELRIPGDGKGLTVYAGNGECILDRSGLTYIGTKNGEDCKMFFPLERIYRLLFGAGENFEIYNGNEIMFFVPEEKRSAVEWYITSSLLYDMNKTSENKGELVSSASI